MMGLTLHNRLLSEFRKSNPARIASVTLILALCLATAFVPASLAQKAPKSERKAIVITKPEYPDILRRAQVGGVVRLRATVLPNGAVSNVEILTDHYDLLRHPVGDFISVDSSHCNVETPTDL